MIRQEVPKIERLKILREKAYRQLELLRKNQDTIATLKKNLIEETETNGWFPKQNRFQFKLEYIAIIHSCGASVINTDNKMITLAHIGGITCINQRFKRKANKATNNL